MAARAQEAAAPDEARCLHCCSMAVVALSLVFVSGVAWNYQLQLGAKNVSLFGAIALVAFSGSSFMLTGVGLVQHPLTATLGWKLIQRVTRTRSNWETDMLRSFSEVGIWMTVIWCTFHRSGGGAGGLLLALSCSTLAGCLLAIAGDALTEPLRRLEKCGNKLRADKADKDSTDLTSGSIMLVTLFAHGSVSMIFQFCNDIVVGCLLASAAGLALVMVAKVIQLWPPMRYVGCTLQGRITRTVENWQKFPVRSAIESTSWLGVLLCTYDRYGSSLFALQIATLCGMLQCLACELFWKDFFGQSVPPQGKYVPPACIFAYGVVSLAVSIFVQVDDWISTAILPAVAAFACFAAGWLLTRFPLTAHVGYIVKLRTTNCDENWAEHPLRSVFEVSCVIVSVWASYSKSGSMCGSVVLGAMTAFLAILASHKAGWGLTCREPPASIASNVQQHAGHPLAHPASQESEAHLTTPVRSRKGESPSYTSPKQIHTWAEVARHNTPEDAWLVIHGKVYDVSSWAPQHPGGSIIYKFVGTDASDQFAAFHMPRVVKKLPRFLIGQIDPCAKLGQEGAPLPPSASTLEYRQLRERLWKEGLFEPQASYYIIKAILFLSLLLASVLVVMCIPVQYFWLRALGGGVLLGLGWQQAAFLAHDAAHYGVSKPQSGGGFNWLAWTIASPVFGISTSMWNEEHSMHHAITLRPREDPQFNYLPLWLISLKELDVPGTRLDIFTRLLVRVQHFTFLPIVVLVGRFNFYLISIGFALKRLVLGPHRAAKLGGFADVLGMAIFWVWLSLLVLQLEELSSRIAFVLTSHWVTGILHIQLLLSHLSTETFTAEEERNEQFFAFQLKTTRNLDVAWYDHWFHGGLEYQIEHHLFPQLPRHSLHKVAPLVKSLAQKHGLRYNSTGFFAALKHIMHDFRKLALLVMTLEQ